MSDYSQAKEDHEQSRGRSFDARTDYRCKAHGCPNAGSIEDLCYWHYREPDPALWAGLTLRIRNNRAMRNWGLVDAPDQTVIENNKNADPQAWAHALREREERGDKLTAAQRDMWRALLRFAAG